MSYKVNGLLEKNFRFKCRGSKLIRCWCRENVIILLEPLEICKHLYYSQSFSSIYLPSVENDILQEIIQIMTENSEIDMYLKSAKDFVPNEEILPKLLEKFDDEFKNFSKDNVLKALNLLSNLEKDDGSHSNRVTGDDDFDKETLLED